MPPNQPSSRESAPFHGADSRGGTAFNFDPNRERLNKYAESAARFRGIVERAGADVLIANHTNFDGSKTKLPPLASRSALVLR